jgi:hypothetical protein
MLIAILERYIAVYKKRPNRITRIMILMSISARKHITMFLQASTAWIAFWLIGLPAYYRQYSDATLGVLCTLLSVAFCLFAVMVLLPRRPERMMPLAFWLSFYYTVPLALYDWLYCGLYLGHGAGYVATYWYLSVFYVSLWLTFIPVAYLLNRTSTQKHGDAAIRPAAAGREKRSVIDSEA